MDLEMIKKIKVDRRVIDCKTDLTEVVSRAAKSLFTEKVCRECQGYLDCNLEYMKALNAYPEIRFKKIKVICSISNSVMHVTVK